MGRRAARTLAVIAITAGLAMGAAACGDDDEDDAAAGATTAVGELCESLEDLSDSIGEATALDPETATADDLDQVNEAITGAADQVSLALEGAGDDEAAVEDLLTQVDDALLDAQDESDVSLDVERLQDALTPVETALSSVESATCSDG